MVTPAGRESENIDGESFGDCSRESLRAPESQGEKAPVRDELDADRTSLFRSEVAGAELLGSGHLHQ